MLKVMIAENDPISVAMIEGCLIDHGYEVCGIARTVDEGVEIAQFHNPDLAILDMRLADGGLGTDIAALLDHDRIGILYATRNVSEVLLNVGDGDACIAKPYRSKDLVRGLEVVAGIISTGIASPPFPRGFQLLDGAIRIGRSG
jgi:CheY-like chemotaxis protein